MILKLFGIPTFCLIFCSFFVFGDGNQKSAFEDYPFQKETITFNKDIKPIMEKSCGGVFCHHGKPSAWTKYATTKAAVDNGTFYKEVIQDKTMPKRKKLSKLEYETIKKWLEEGAIEK